MTLTTSEGSRAQVEQVLTLFMSDNNFQVLALKGKWGVGKTHLIKDFLDRKKQDFYYASVFGLSSIDQLKSRILAGHKPKIDNPTISENLQTDVKIVGKRLLGNIWGFFSKNSSRIEKNSGIGDFKIAGSLITMTGDLAFNLIFNNIKGSLICIDDLERKSNLNLDEILGFTEYLVQDLKCRVIIIYNEQKLTEDENSKDTLSLKEYREKVIDIEVELNPTVEENFSLIFRDNYPDSEMIKNTFILANTNNIRVLKKTKWNLEQFQPLMQEWHSKTRKEIIEHIITISLAKLDTSFGASMFTVLNINEYFFIHGKDKLTIAKSYPELTEEQIKKIMEEVRFLRHLFKSHYYNLDVDRHIAGLVNSCLFDQKDFQEKGKLLNEKHHYFEIKEKLTKVYDPYYNSFNDSTDELLENINSFLELHYKEIDFDTFVKLCEFCSSINLDISKYKKKVFEHIIEDAQNLAELQKTNPHLLIIFKNEIDKKYPELSKILDQKLELIKLNSASRNITDILKSRESENSISRNDQIFLDNQSLDDYCEWLRNGHADLLLMVKFYLRFKTETGSKNLEAAIKRLAEESQSGLNAVRAEYLFGITSQNIPTPDNTSEIEPQYKIIVLEDDPDQ